LAINTRPDILFAVNKASRRSKESYLNDWMNVQKIFRYLKETLDYGINYSRNNNINAYVDADYAGDVETRRLTTGFLITIGNAPTSWCSKLQHYVATSTAESEYYSINEYGKQWVWYLNILNKLNYNINSIEINVDNKAAIYNSKYQSVNLRTKHIDVRFNYIRELVKDNKIKLKYIKSSNNLADSFTKYLNSTLMNKFKSSLFCNINDLNII